MQIELVNFQTESQSIFQKLVSKLTESERKFIKDNYEKTNGGFYVLYSYQIQNLNAEKQIDGLLKKGIGIYSSVLGHSIPSQLFNLI
jgi:hypothetical protein